MNFSHEHIKNSLSVSKKFILLLFLTSNIQLLTSKADNTGQINGTVTDSISGEPLIGANVYVSYNGNLVGTTTDVEGYYVLKPLQPGMYDVAVSFMGYTKKIFSGIKVSQGSIKMLNVKLSSSIDLPEVKVNAQKYDDLISVDPIGGEVPEELLQKPTVRGTAELVATLPGIFQSDSGEELYFRGSRPESTEYYVDNVKIIGDYNVPASAIAEIKVYSGGIPARYGDVTGGVVVITTKSYNMYRNSFE